MKNLFLTLIVFSFFQAEAQTLNEVRDEFHKAVKEPSYSKEFHDFLKDKEFTDPTILAYKAVSEAMLAQVLWNPVSKLSQVFKYDKQMQVLVAENENNVEVRFLRLAIEYNLPSFLGMSTHVQEDLNAILSNMDSVRTIAFDPSYGRYIFYFLESTQLCSSDQMVAIQKTLSSQSL